MAETKAAIPGGPLKDWQLFEPKVMSSKEGLKTVGTRTPDGRYHSFTNGEEMVFVRQGNDRVPMIRLQDGQTVAFSAWEASRREEYGNIFDQLNPSLGRIYMQMVNDFPEILDVNIELDDTGRSVGKFALGSILDDSAGTITVSRAPGNMLTGMGDRTVELIAESIGISPDVVRQNPIILQAFTLFHEFGHAYDYVANYLDNPDVYHSRIPRVVFSEQARSEMETMFFPGLPPHRVKELVEDKKLDLNEFLRINKKYCHSHGIKTPDDLFDRIQEQYRSLPKEKKADQFSANLLRKYWHLL